MRTMSGSPCPYYDCHNRNSFGYCKTTVCIKPKYSNLGTAQYGQVVQKRIITNGDRIRAMSDEELAEKFFLFPCVHVLDDKVKCKDDGCKKCWMRWLREECKNEN